MNESDDEYVGSCENCGHLILDPENHESDNGGVICPQCFSTDVLFIERYYLQSELDA